MSPKDQEKLFEEVQKRHKLWTPWEASGYVHGVVQGLTCKEPPHVYIQRFLGNEPYACGFIYGFIDAYGNDVFTSKWIRELELSKAILHYRWWEKK